ncbi:DUF5412 family protein [Bacillus horti]|uniref:Uncharacterized protein n=1 Tax=Caldalkalibacillus horti TaxID=77523 RepID=A0ABT9VY40_9BACI|nr:DUF5412 family protein [Bacillus horti]MDQ0165913.1 hypothetical protein [Bacillus horti]
MKKYNLIAFFLMIFCYLIVAYSIYSLANNTWLIAPPNYVILLLSILTFIIGVMGFKDVSSWHAKVRSWLTTIFSSLLVVLLFITLAFTSMFSGAKELITTVNSPDGYYTIDFFYTDAGAMGTFGILGELNGPLWFKKRIYTERRVDQVEVEWENNHTILINDNTLDLSESAKFP